MQMSFPELFRLIVDELVRTFHFLVTEFPSLVVALVVFLLFYLGAKVICLVYDRFVGSGFRSQTLAHLSSFIIKFCIILVGFFCAAHLLGLHKTIISLLAGLGLLGLALGVAFRDLATNVISGIVLGVKKPFKRGDLIQIDDVLGTVLKVEFRMTYLQSRDNQLVIIPNRTVIQSTVINYCGCPPLRKKIDLTVSFGENLDFVVSVITEAVMGLNFIDKEKGAQVFALGFGEFGMHLSVRFWFDFPHPEVDFRQSEHLAVMAIKKALDENGIKIPFPIRTLDFNPKGGRPLSAEITGLKD